MEHPGQYNAGGRFSSFTVNMLFILFALAGLALFSKLTVKLNPGSSANFITVSYTYQGAAPQVVEHEVTSLLEGAVSSISGISQIESLSGMGYGSIIMEVEKGTDKETLRFAILSAIKDIWQHMPEGVGYPEIYSGSQSAENELLISYSINGDGTPAALKDFADKRVRKILSKVDGISGIETYGATPYEWVFTYNREQLKQYNLSPDDLSQALDEWQQVIGIGMVKQFDQSGCTSAIPVSIAISVEEELAQSWRTIPIAELDGRIILLGDVVKLVIKEQQPSSYFRINGRNTVSVNIYASPSSNLISLARQINREEEKLQSALPTGWSLIKMFDSSEYLKNELQKTTMRLGAAIILLFLFVLFIQRSWRYLLLIVLSLNVNIAIAFICYYFFGVEIHLISIAGITVSIGIIIDNYIVMADYLLNRRSLNVFLAMLGATLTTLSALVVIFFLDESDKANLIDFAFVTILNLCISLVVALWFIPSLIKGMGISNRINVRPLRRMRTIGRLNRVYRNYIRLTVRWRYAFFVLLIPVIGLPFRLFMQHVSDRSNFYQPAGETTLYVKVSLPTGTTINQLNDVCLKMESYLKGHQGIRQFQTNVNNPQDASIIIYFTEDAQNSMIPFQVKELMIQKAMEFAGADFGINMRNEKFSNELIEDWRLSQIQLSGYDYGQLVIIARELSDTLSLNPRITDIAIFSGNDIFLLTSTVEEKGLKLKRNALASVGVSYMDYVNAMQQYNSGATAQTIIEDENGYTPVSFYADDLSRLDLWQFMHTAMGNDSVKMRPLEIADLTVQRVDGNIYKKNQSYIIRVAYNFLGPDELARRVLARYAEKIRTQMPLGFKAETPDNDYSWMFSGKPLQYWLLGLIVIMIWAIGAILFESLIQPFIVVSAIPLSFTGAFLTFYYFKIPFDEGGYAALLLLCGLSVNMVIYILNDLNHLRKYNKRTGTENYLKAFNLKIVPVLLSTLTTVAGLVPFLIFDKVTGFWTAFAAGTIGGVLVSVPLLIVFLPLFLKSEPKVTKIF